MSIYDYKYDFQVTSGVCEWQNRTDWKKYKITMKSLTIASVVSALYVLWLSNYVAEGVEVKIKKCDLTNQADGGVNLKEINIDSNKVKGTKLDIQKEVLTGSVMLEITIITEEDDVVFKETDDLCSMANNALFKNYFLSFEQAEFNEGNCPLQMGSYSSGEFDISVDDAPKGVYRATLDITEDSNQLLTINCEAEIE